MELMNRQIYRDHQKPEVQAIMDMDVLDIAGRSAAAQKLIDQGAIIDWLIVVRNADPYIIMRTRMMYGGTWAPAGGQPEPTAAELAGPPPALCITPLSVDAADYPPNTPPE